MAEREREPTESTQSFGILGWLLETPSHIPHQVLEPTRNEESSADNCPQGRSEAELLEDGKTNGTTGIELARLTADH
jgi:hypothetical protein